jgi:hypothetical protein
MEEFATALWPEQPVTAGKATPRPGHTLRPGGGPTTPAPKGPVTADTPTEFVQSAAAAATTPMPVAQKPRPPGAPASHAAPPSARPGERQGKSSKAPVFIGIGVVAIGVAAFVVLRGSGKQAPPPVATSQTPAAQPTTQAPAQTPPARIDTAPTPAPKPVATASPPTAPATKPARRTQRAPAAASPPTASGAQGTITIDAQPYGEVFVDGKDIGPTPQINIPVSVGSHKIRIERPGFKTINETIQVDAQNPVRKRYSLTPE